MTHDCLYLGIVLALVALGLEFFERKGGSESPETSETAFRSFTLHHSWLKAADSRKAEGRLVSGRFQKCAIGFKAFWPLNMHGKGL